MSARPWLLASLALLVAFSAHRPTRAGAPPPRRAVAITYFDNHTADPALAPLSRGLADMLITDLTTVGTLRVVERSRLNQVLDELALSKSPFIDPQTAQTLGRGLAAEYILTGGLLVSGDTLRVDARLIRVATGEVAFGEKVEGPKGDFFAIEKELVDLIVQSLRVDLAFSERSALRRNPTQSWEAWVSYARGLEALDTDDRAKALAHFHEALAADPRYQAARDATERLKVLVTRDAEARERLATERVEALDPRAPDFPAQVDRLFSDLGQDSAATRQRLRVLRWLVDQDLQPMQHGVSRVVLETQILLARAIGDPDLRPLVPGACEYLMLRYPEHPGVGPQCKSFLETIARFAPLDAQALRSAWKTQLETADTEWMIAYRDHRETLRDLLATMGDRARSPSPSIQKPRDGR